MEFVIIGRSGSGKSTLATKMSTYWGLPIVSSGAIARSLAQEDPLTKTALRVGEYAPEGAMRVAVRHEIENATLKKGGYILEGFPRSMAQLIALQMWTQTDPVFIFLDVPTGICIRRLIKRGREHDAPDAIHRRFEAFQNDTMPVVATLREMRALYEYDGCQDIDSTFDQIAQVMN